MRWRVWCNLLALCCCLAVELRGRMEGFDEVPQYTPRLSSLRPNFPNMQPTAAIPQPQAQPQQLLRNLLVAMAAAKPQAQQTTPQLNSGTQPLAPQPALAPTITELKPIPLHVTDAEKQTLVKHAQNALDTLHLMPDDMQQIIQNIGSYSLHGGAPPSKSDVAKLHQFLQLLQLSSPGTESVMHFLNSVSSGSKPAAPSKPFLTGICNILWLIQVVLMMPLLQIPALVQMFIEPMMMVPPPVRQPAVARPRTPDDKIFHAYGDYGDFGYEHRNMKGYGCASGKCAPWWWTWRKRSPYYPFIGRDAP